MRRFATVVWATQVLVTTIAFLACLDSVESILVTGPALSVAGLMLAAATRQLRSWPTIGFGLSAPLVCALGATMIGVGGWTPSEAQRPIAILLGAYFLAMIPLAAIALLAIRQWRPKTLSEPGVWQYSMKTLLIWMTAMCVLAAVGQYVLQDFTIRGIRGEGYTFIAFALATVLLAGANAWWFLAKRCRAAKSTESADEPPGLSQRE